MAANEKDNVIDLDKERILRHPQPETHEEADSLSDDENTNAEAECKDGVCVVQWRPRRPAA